MKNNKKKIAVLDRDKISTLLEVISKKGYELYGPTIDNGSIVYEQINTAEDLPIDWKECQSAGHYHLEKNNRNSLFGYTVGSNSWKKYLHPSCDKLWSVTPDGDRFTVNIPEGDIAKRALIGVRPCEIHALTIHDRIFTEGQITAPLYIGRRKNIFIVAVNCTDPGGTCFCASMKTGPGADSGYDLLLTEIIDSNNHYFLIESGSKSGSNILNKLPVREAAKAELDAASKIMRRAEEMMGRTLKTKGLKDLLQSNFDNSHWANIAERCLSCGNCTMVCPTCFCVNIEDTTDLTGTRAERLSRWDSCFTVDFSYIHGGSIRTSVASRYRQWMMHKLAYWVDQFGTFGCVGCGRCITWCPAGIDITEEANVFSKK